MKKYVKSSEDADEFMYNFDNLPDSDKLEFAELYLRTYIAPDEALDLFIDVYGYDYDKFCDILYAKTAYRDFDQLYGEGGEEIAELLDLNL